MLLYTRLAPPKIPKKRSRAGCCSCKEKRKKCDETRPQCALCQKHGWECRYEPIKPRQRRKRGSGATLPLDANSPSSGSGRTLQLPDATVLIPQWKQERRGSDAPFDAAPIITEQNPLSGKQMSSPISSLLTLSPTDLPIVSRIDSIDFKFTSLDETIVSNQDDDAEESAWQDSLALANTTLQSPRTPSLSLIATVSVPSPRFEFCSPAFTEFSERTNRRALVDHFCNVLSHLIVFQEECGNPFQQLILPLCHNSQAVINAVYALASAHLENRGVENEEKSVYFYNKSIQGLANLIEKGENTNPNELLAAVMLLVYYDVLVQKNRSNIVDGHLKGAISIMGNNQATADPTRIFLERIFQYFDVITALSLGTAPLSTAPRARYLSPPPSLGLRGALSPLGSVDTLLGMATSLWPIIHRLLYLHALKDQLDVAVTYGELSTVFVLRTEFETTASAIETALKEWHPILPPDTTSTQDPQDLSADKAAERAHFQSILNNALAYYHSAFVWLYREIHGYSREHPLVQGHTHVSLTHCVGVVSNSGPMGALLWPLFVAACEATSLGDRELARQAFVTIDRRQGMLNIKRAWRIVQEVWRRADKAEMMQHEEGAMMMTWVKGGGHLWRRVSDDMGMTIVFG